MPALPPQVLFAVLNVPVDSSYAAAVALTVVYSILSTTAYGYFAIWKYAPYLDAALGAGGELLGDCNAPAASRSSPPQNEARPNSGQPPVRAADQGGAGA